jgi:glycine/D-amino acid oxidase-like deaminating enzyme
MTLDMNRRGVILAGLGTAAVASVAKAAVPAIGRNLPDVVVIGAGAFGGWTALSLQEAGFKTTLVDAYGPGNPHASSGGETRNIRSGYGDRAIYSEWASRAWTAWHEREQEFGRKLIYPSGSLRDPGEGQMEAQIAVYDRLKLPYEMLSSAEVSKRWPQIAFPDRDKVFFDVHSGGVKAREAMIAVSEIFERKGGKIKLGWAMPGKGSGGKLETILVNGEPLSAGIFVFALGPWFPKVFPTFMGDMLRSPRAELFFVAPARGDNRYRWENAPSISDTITYTTADIGGGYKIAAHPKVRTLMDPDDGDRMPTPDFLPMIRDYVKLRFPGLVGRPILSSYVCQTEVTNTGHYIFDTHPEYANAWLAGGGSGHAFKMGPVLGTYVTDLVAGKPMPAEHEKIFRLKAHGPANGPTANMTA